MRMEGSLGKFLLAFIIVNCFQRIDAQSRTLIAGHVLFRHGDRTPIVTFPTDPSQEKDWPNGFGQLTARGIEQQHHLGGVIRKRYNDLLSPNYTRSEIVVRSTDVDRTLMSAQSNLVGLYPVSNPPAGAVPIQPIPIHTVSINSDFLLGQSDCPRYDQVEEEVTQSDEMKQADAYYQPFFDKLQKWTNLTNITIYNAWDVADTIFVENIYNRLPDWAQDPEVRQNLTDINDLAFHFLFANNITQRLRGGPSVLDMWQNMNDAITNKSFKKVKVYSAHDTTVSAVLAFLQINYPHQPQYASALFIDLWKQNSSYFVEVSYLNVTDSETAYPWILPGCENALCPFETFTNIYQPTFPGDPEVECRRLFPPAPPTPDNSGGIILATSFIISALVMLTIMMFLCVYLRKTNDDNLLVKGEPSIQNP